MVGETYTGIIKLKLDYPVRDFQSAKKEILGIDTAVEGAGKTFVSSGNRLDFLRQRTTGLRREVSSLRNSILLLVFSTGAFVAGLQKTVDASVKFQVALAGVRSVALATGNDISGVKAAAISLTNDGLLSLSGAATGLKNLLATGLNLKQSTDIMNVFKNAAAFNRQGILEFEEAIVRATAGVKMQQARLIDDVGIRMRVGQMLQRQGFAIEDLTNETTKAAAVQALYNGLMQEGRFFLGDAAKLTDTYAGVQARLESQLFKTRAAFGDVLTGVSSTNGVFKQGLIEIFNFTRELQRDIELNKDLIAVKVDEYFERIKITLNGLLIIFKPILFVLEKLIDIVGNSIIGSFIIWGFVIERTILKLVLLQKNIIAFGGTNLTWIGLKGTWALAKYGNQIESVINELKQLRGVSTAVFSNLDFGKILKESPLTSKRIIQAQQTLSGIQTGKTNIPIISQDFQKQVALAKVNFTAFTTSLSKDLQNINVNNLKDIETRIKALTVAFPKTREALIPLIAEFDKSKIALEGMKQSSTGLAIIPGLFTKMWVGIKAFGTALKLTLIEFLPLLAIQVAIAGIIYLIDNLNGKTQKQKEIEETMNRLRKESLQAQKDIFDSKLAEIKSIQDSIEEYKGLDATLFKTSSQYNRMIDIQQKVNGLLSKHSELLDKSSNSQNKSTSSLINDVNIREKIGLALQRQAFTIEDFTNKITKTVVAQTNSTISSQKSIETTKLLIGVNSNYAEILTKVTKAAEDLTKAEIERQKLSILTKQTESLTAVGEKLKESGEDFWDKIWGDFTQGSFRAANTVANNLSKLAKEKGFDDIAIKFKNIDVAINRFGISSLEVGTKASEAFKLIDQKIIDIDKELERLTNLKLAGIISQDTLDKESYSLFLLKRDLETLRTAIKDAGIDVTNFDELLKALDITAEEVAKKTQMASISFRRFVSDLEIELQKAKSIGNLADKILDVVRKTNDRLFTLEQLAIKLDAKNFKDDIQKAHNLIDKISKIEVKKILEESLIPLRKMNEGFELELKKMGATEINQKLIEVDLKRINELEKLRNEQDSAHSGMLQFENSINKNNLEIERIRIDNLQERMRLIKESGEKDTTGKLTEKAQKAVQDLEKMDLFEKLNTISLKEQNSLFALLISQIKDALAISEKYKDNLDKITALTKNQIFIEHALGVEKELSAMALEIDKANVARKYSINLLLAATDMQAILNQKLNQENVLLELNNKLEDLNAELSIYNLLVRLKILGYDAIHVKILQDKIDLVKQEIENVTILGKLKLDELKMEKELNDIKQKRELRTTIATTGVSGAVIDILGGGKQVGGKQTYEEVRKGLDDINEAMGVFNKTQKLAFEAFDESLNNIYKSGGGFDKIKEAIDIFNDTMEKAGINMENNLNKSLDNIAKSFTTLFENIANLAINTFDLFGEKAQDANEQTKQNLRVDQLLLDDQFKNREITLKEYEAQRTLLNKKAAIEEERAAKVRAAEEKIAFGNILKGLAIEFAARGVGEVAAGIAANAAGVAATALAAGPLTGGAPYFAAAAGHFAAAAAYGVAAIGTGGAGIALIKSGQGERAAAEAQARLQTTLAEREASRAVAGTTTSTDTGKSISGNISAQELKIIIAPTTTISTENGTIIIGNTGIEEVSRILSDATVQRIQEAIDNRELQLGNIQGK